MVIPLSDSDMVELMHDGFVVKVIKGENVVITFGNIQMDPILRFKRMTRLRPILKLVK